MNNGWKTWAMSLKDLNCTSLHLTRPQENEGKLEVDEVVPQRPQSYFKKWRKTWGRWGSTSKTSIVPQLYLNIPQLWLRYSWGIIKVQNYTSIVPQKSYLIDLNEMRYDWGIIEVRLRYSLRSMRYDWGQWGTIELHFFLLVKVPLVREDVEVYIFT
jgi:hypothetical protein